MGSNHPLHPVSSKKPEHPPTFVQESATTAFAVPGPFVRPKLLLDEAARSDWPVEKIPRQIASPLVVPIRLPTFFVLEDIDGHFTHSPKIMYGLDRPFADRLLTKLATFVTMADMLGILNWVKNLHQVLKGRPWYLPPPLTERQVAQFERAQGVRLPEDYRNYLLTVAGAPPGYARGYGLHDCLEEQAKYRNFLQSPFPHGQGWNEWESEDYGDDKHVAGSLLLTHEGCTHYLRLVVTGAMRGTVWEDSRGADGGIVPLTNSSGEPKTFKEWIGQFGWTRCLD